MNKILITLKPLTPYFFGGENTFGDGKINYFARSNYLPQQTTLLGMLRHELLIQNNLIGTDPIAKEWKLLIGEDSFQKLNNKFVDDFGAIKNISPVFISDGNIHYTTQTLDWANYGLEKDEKVNNCAVMDMKIAPVIVDFFNAPNDFVIFENYSKSIPSLLVNNKPFDPKYGLVSLWVSSDGKNLRQWDYVDPLEFEDTHGFDNGFFIKHEQVGIHREIVKRRDDKGDFYKQVFYKLANDFCFAFFVDLDLPNDKEFGSRIITMGGERSFFKMEVTDAKEKSFDNIFDKKTFQENHCREHDVIILTSNCFCSNDVIENCLFTINDDVNFQNIVTQQKNAVNYVAFQKGGVTKSGENLTLLKRGTVLYPYTGKTNEVEKALKSDAFNKIGYNKYLIINK
ncbi:MAG TPA: type III-B CRISPR module-associated Cmr3 family protein [Bacteroidales bacterium]|nr:type III-B CRISPR module-associated Cmr3 family protein [Bacteroidales bacterium]